jgi:alanine racemase
LEITTQHLAEIIHGTLHGNPAGNISEILIDSRSRCLPERTAFFALSGPHHDGHQYIDPLYQKGVRCFVVASRFKFTHSEATFIQVDNTLDALQLLATHLRSQYQGVLIGITGSNGKTVVKEWIAHLLSQVHKVIRSPRSYNSQVGVPLSLFLLENSFDFAVIEAGISKPGEMVRLERMIRPGIGIITNIGEPHQENFLDLEHKLDEKMQLFKHCHTLIYCKDHERIHQAIQAIPKDRRQSIFHWAIRQDADLTIRQLRKGPSSTMMEGGYQGVSMVVEIPFTDQASIENAIHAWMLMLVLKMPPETIASGLKSLSPVAMRLELKQGINQCTIINDIYNSDLASLEIALDFMNQLPGRHKNTLILSDILQSGRTLTDLYNRVARLIKTHDIKRFIGIGEALFQHADKFEGEKKFYKSTEEFVTHFRRNLFRNEHILLKGARQFEFEKISSLLENQVHETVLEINMNALIHNLNQYRSLLQPDTKIMVMVKAFSYGSGSFEIAQAMQHHGVDMLAVAYTDEGVALRDEGIGLPIMVMSPDPASLMNITTYTLEPEIYSFRLLDAVLKHLEQHQMTDYPVHVKLDTGMNRLGFKPWEVDALIDRIKDRKELKVQSVFSHLASSDDNRNDDFSQQQIQLFGTLKEKFQDRLPGLPPLFHILNSAGIIRFPSHQFDMVRLGIGLHGYTVTKDLQLAVVGTFKSTVIQVKEARPGETIGYGLEGRTDEPRTIATIPVGYADGLNRKLGHRRGMVYVRGKRVPIVGSVCMDMCMVDVTGLDIREGDRVEIFGPNIPADELSVLLDTIPYEILTGISRRVKRVYIQE